MSKIYQEHNQHNERGNHDHKRNKPKLYMLIEIVCDDEMDCVKTEEEWLREFEESEEFEDWMEGKTAKELFDEFRRNEMLIEVERDDFDQWVKVEDAP